MVGFFSRLNRWKLRLECSDCNKKGKPIDNTHVYCARCNSTWDGKAEFDQQVILIKEVNTVVRAL